MELLKRFKQGDVDAFETLFRQFQGEVFGWIVQIVRDPGIAEDLTIETFWRIHKARERFDTEAAFGAWARRIARNLAIDHIRVRRREHELSEQALSVETPDLALRRETREKIERALRQLPPKLQAAATLALVDERPYQEIADLLGVPVGVIRTRVFRAVRQLRKQLERMGVKP
jgi:RNA polymerase sigma-70 factor (ECF subfamily)